MFFKISRFSPDLFRKFIFFLEMNHSLDTFITYNEAMIKERQAPDLIREQYLFENFFILIPGGGNRPGPP